MKRTVTLELDESVVDFLEAEAKRAGTSLESLIESSVLGMTRAEHDALPTITKQLVGILKGSDVDEEDYKRYLEAKYLR